jgi:prolyl-tRNA synthetase
VLGVPVQVGRKTRRERFAGADHSWTCEGMMRDGKALQMGTSHELGQNFAKVFDTHYLDAEGKEQFVWQTSWGVSTRLLGAVIMAHGDDKGLRLPPAVAPVQVVVLLVRDEDGSGERARVLGTEIAELGHRVRVDDSVDVSFGRRVTDWELKGVPVRLEVGPRDLAEGNVTLVRRDTAEKQAVPLAEAAARASLLVRDIQANLLAESTRLRDAATVEVATVEDAAEAAKTGWARLPWSAVGEEGEDRLATSSVSVRCLQATDGSLPNPSQEDDLMAYVGRAY